MQIPPEAEIILPAEARWRQSGHLPRPPGGAESSRLNRQERLEAAGATEESDQPWR